MQAEAKKMSETPEVFEGVQVSMVNAKVLQAYLKGAGMTGANARDPKKLLGVYAELLKQQDAQGVEFLDCKPGCGARSMAALRQCPVCGAVDDGDKEEVVEAVGEVLEPVGKALAPAASREAELDASLGTIRQHVSGMVQNLWVVGTELLKIHEQKLYLSRPDPVTGAPMYKDWNTFCAKEVRMSGMHARNLMFVCATRSEEEVKQTGFTKLLLVAKADPADRERLLTLAKSNVSLRQLAKEAKFLPEAPQRAVGQQGANEAAARKAPSRPEPQTLLPQKGGLTVVFKSGTVELKGVKDQKGNFTCSEEMLNAVKQDIEFNPKTGIFRINRYREES